MAWPANAPSLPKKEANRVKQFEFKVKEQVDDILSPWVYMRESYSRLRVIPLIGYEPSATTLHWCCQVLYESTVEK